MAAVTLTALREAAEFLLLVALFYFAVTGLLRWRWSSLAKKVETHRALAILLLALAVIAAKVGEDVLEGEIGPVDEAVLRYIHRVVPPWMGGVFQAITLTGSGDFLGALVILSLLAFVIYRRWREALLLLGSAVTSGLLVIAVKAAVGRTRPLLRETDWHPGPSFPSGHTLATSAIAVALVLSLARIDSRTVPVAAPLAGLWIVSVGFSRLVLGVHWPSDVVTAVGVGINIPFLALVLIEHFADSSGSDNAAVR